MGSKTVAEEKELGERERERGREKERKRERERERERDVTIEPAVGWKAVVE